MDLSGNKSVNSFTRNIYITKKIEMGFYQKKIKNSNWISSENKTEKLFKINNSKRNKSVKMLKTCSSSFTNRNFFFSFDQFQ